MSPPDLPPVQALQGIQVLDLTRIGPGPFCTMLLADMGADVLRVQAPPQLEAEGRVQRFFGDDETRGLAYQALGRNKRSIALNLRTDAARAIFHELCRTADVVIEGFRPGVVDRLGVGYRQVSETNPRTVYCSLSGYGQTGPYATVPGHDVNYISLGGAQGMIGSPDGRPAIPINLIADYGGGGMMAAFGILCALRARDLTGRGQFVDIAMMDGVTGLLAREWSSHFETGVVPQPGRHALGGSRVEYNVYECSDGKWISIGSSEPRFYANFCRAIGREDFIARQGAGPEEQREMIAAAAAVFKTRTRDAWEALLLQTDQCVAPVLGIDELEHHPQVQARQLVLELDHPVEGHVKQPGFAVKLSDTPGAFRSFGVLPGAHTDAVLAALGHSPEAIAALRAAGAVA